MQQTYATIIGRIIAGKRKALGMEKSGAAEKAGLDLTVWSRVESGISMPDLGQLSQIAQALGCSPADLIALADEKKESLKKEGVAVPVPTRMATTYTAIIGRIIAERREALGMEQGEAAKKADISRSTWSRIENGDSKPDIVQLSSIAKALGCSTADITNLAEEAKKNLEQQGFEVHMSPPKSTSTGNVALALIGKATLGVLVRKAMISPAAAAFFTAAALIYAATKYSKKDDEEG